jgi:4-amino-4-deoxy-L-arabinose transferase-like glycosyltransferase
MTRVRGQGVHVTLVALLGMALLVRAQWLWAERPDTVQSGLLPALIGLILLIVVARQQTSILPHITPLPAYMRSFGLKRRRVLIGAVGLAVCMYVGVRAVEEDLLVWKLLGLWAAGIALIAAGLISGEDWRRWRRRLITSWREERRAWLGVGGLFLVALAIRTVSLETVPYIMSGDDAQFAQEAVYLKDERGWVYNPFSMGFWHHPRIVHTLMALSIHLLGRTVAASRMPWAVLGALTVPATYLLARRLFDERVGWCAALILCTLPVHIFFSRISMDMTGDTCFLALAVALTVGALYHNDMVEAALAGVSLGLTQYFYFAGRLAPLIIGGALVLYAIYDRRRLWQRWGAILALVVVTAGVVFPGLYAVYADRQRSLNPRLQHVGIWQTGDVQGAAERGELKDYVINQLQRSLLTYVAGEDESDVYGRYGPLLSWYAGVPFLIGLAVLLSRWREPRSGLLIGWLSGTALLGGAMLVDPPHFPRYVNALPAAAVVAAVGVVWGAERLMHGVAVWRGLLEPGGNRLTAWRFGVPVGMALALASVNLLLFIYGYLPKTGEILYGERTRRLNDVVTILDRFEGRYAVWRFSSLDLDMNSTSLLHYLTPENAGQEYEANLFAWREVLQPGPTAFVIAPERLDEVLSALAVYFPAGNLHEYRSPRDGSPLVYIYVVDIPPREGEQRSGQDG